MFRHHQANMQVSIVDQFFALLWLPLHEQRNDYSTVLFEASLLICVSHVQNIEKRQNTSPIISQMTNFLKKF